MANVFDTAAYILARQGPMTPWKLQKLVYYCQAWSLVWDGRPLFQEAIEAWAHGPVVRELTKSCRGIFRVRGIPEGGPERLTKDEQETVDAVLDHYGNYSGQYLSDLVHLEDPWRMAREGIPSCRRFNSRISLESLAEYYGGLEPDEDT